MKRLLYGVVACGLLVGFSGPARAQYTFTTIDFPQEGVSTAAFGINASGQIVGSYDNGQAHGFLLDVDGSYTTLDPPGSTYTEAWGINNSGQIVGYYTDAGGRAHGLLLDVDGSYTTIDVPGSTFTRATGINNYGQIVGFDGIHGFLLDVDGSFTTLDVPGAGGTSAVGINNLGQIVGWYNDARGAHGFLLDVDGSFTTLDVPAGTIRRPLASTTRARSWEGTLLINTTASSGT
jgi:hypothetical protein